MHRRLVCGKNLFVTTSSDQHDLADDGTHTDLAAAESLALIEAQRREVGAQLEPDARLLYGLWGLALLIGEGAFFLATWDDSPVEVSMPLAGTTLFVSLASAMVISSVHIARRVAGVQGNSSRQGMFYRWTWMVGFVSLAAIISGVTRTGIDDAAIGLLWAAGSGLVIGLLYMAGGAMWLDRTQFALGAWFAVVSGAGAVAGTPWIYLVLAVAGGGGLLAVAATLAARSKLSGP